MTKTNKQEFVSKSWLKLFGLIMVTLSLSLIMIVFENSIAVAIKDIYPKAPVHILIIPKKHIVSINQMEEADKELMGGLFLIAKQIAVKKKLNGYKLLFNVGRESGQIVDHLHLHLLGGKMDLEL